MLSVWEKNIDNRTYRPGSFEPHIYKLDGITMFIILVYAKRKLMCVTFNLYFNSHSSPDLVIYCCLRNHPTPQLLAAYNRHNSAETIHLFTTWYQSVYSWDYIQLVAGWVVQDCLVHMSGHRWCWLESGVPPVFSTWPIRRVWTDSSHGGWDPSEQRWTPYRTS